MVFTSHGAVAFMPELATSTSWSAYSTVLMALAGIGVLSLVQLLVADLVGILSRHRPGHPVAADGSSFLFRAVRAHANTNESLPAFTVLALVAVFVAVPAGAANALCAVYFLGRLAHMVCYYLGWSLARSLSFALSVVGLVGLAGCVLWSMLLA